MGAEPAPPAPPPPDAIHWWFPLKPAPPPLLPKLLTDPPAGTVCATLACSPVTHPFWAEVPEQDAPALVEWLFPPPLPPEYGPVLLPCPDAPPPPPRAESDTPLPEKVVGPPPAPAQAEELQVVQPPAPIAAV